VAVVSCRNTGLNVAEIAQKWNKIKVDALLNGAE